LEIGERVYLGDGAYAWFDGFQIWVEAERDGMLHQVALEPYVWQQLVAFAENFYKRKGDRID
jgi:hypothetical protein